LIVDLAVAWTLAVLFYVPLPVAAAVGFGCGAHAELFASSVWTFGAGREHSPPSGCPLWDRAHGGADGAYRKRRLPEWLIGDPKGYELAILVAATGIRLWLTIFCRSTSCSAPRIHLNTFPDQCT
jgi:hypothetical protein